MVDYSFSGVRLARLCALALLLLTSCSLILGDFEIVRVSEEECTRACNHEFLLGCEGEERVLIDTCITEAQCDSERGLCTECMVGDTRCNGSMREACSIDQTSWEPLEDCGAEACNKTHCGACTPNEVQCAGDESRELLFCTADGGYVSMGVCASAPLCAQSIDRYRTDMTQSPACIAEVCTPGALGCDGERLRRCHQAGDDWDVVSTCASPALCEQALLSTDGVMPSCVSGCSPPSSFRCVENGLEQCASDSTAWNAVEDCGALGLVCDSTQGACGGPCTPDSYRCNSVRLEVCDATERWTLSAVCETAPLCVATQDLVGVWHAECRAPHCLPDEIRCNPDDLTRLEQCNPDRTGYTLLDTCASPELCRANDGRCDMPVCMPELDGTLPLRCHPTDPLVVQQCRPDLTDYDPILTCAEGEFCDQQDPADPCKTECPAAFLCRGAELLHCSGAGIAHVADCATPTLCECVLDGTCQGDVGQNGCGIPVCGGTLPEYRCTGASLERCETGRNGWQAGVDCGAPDLCRPGTAPAYDDGYCALCPNTGEVRCQDDGSGHHTCGPDGKTWVQDVSCAQGCLERVGESADYCAVCAEDEARCEGTMPGSARLRHCADDRSSLDNGAVCAYGCIDDGFDDRCAACVTGERRCFGNVLNECNTARSALSPVMTCGQSCIDSGTDDYCGTCVPGSTQCNGDSLQTCGNDGNWGTGSACVHGCIARTGNDICAPTCRPGTYDCSGAQLLSCNDAGEWVNASLCASASHCDEAGRECDQCLSGEYSCSGATLRSCDANGRWTAASSPCAGSTLRTCPGGAVTTPTTQSCTICDATNRQCDDCAAQTTPYSCSQGTLRQCDNTGHWNASGIPNCSGQTLRTCSANTLDTTTCGASETCTETANACYECTPGTYRCSSGSVQLCDSTGHWAAGAACTGSTERSCNSMGVLETKSCPPSQTCNAAGTACNVCNNGDTRCSGTTKQTCTMRMWGDDEPCDLGCVVSGGAALCAECTSGTRCDPADLLQPQSCSGGLWSDMGAACTGACISGSCAACDDDPDCGGDLICSLNSCVECTSTNTAACGATTPVCLENECVACMPPSTRCSGTQPQSCNASGAWTNNGAACSGDTPECVGGACRCTAGAQRCNLEQPEICSSGSWVANGDVCPMDEVCTAGACVTPP